MQNMRKEFYFMNLSVVAFPSELMELNLVFLPQNRKIF